MSSAAASTPRVALVHHWLVAHRGGEKVLEALCELLPGADIFTLACEPDRVSGTIRRHRVFTSFIERLPLGRRHFRWYLPLFPQACEQWDLGGYDLVISSDACVVKGVLTAADCPHVCYCHSPPRYLWDLYREYYDAPGTGRLRRLFMPPVAHYLRTYDYLAAQRVDYFVANSRTVAARIAKNYRRHSHVIYPPVDTEYFSAASRNAGDYYLFAGQLVSYKRADAAIAAAARTGRRLVVAGDGPELRRLRRGAAAGIEFRGAVSDEELRELYAGCRALLFPGEEDFGIVPVEAQAAGAPVIALGRGGATESVVDGVTGVLFETPGAAGLEEAIRRFESMEGSFDSQACRASAERFSRNRFLDEARRLIDGVILRRRTSREDSRSPTVPDTQQPLAGAAHTP